jgi:SAM-dependent methyltransferase
VFGAHVVRYAFHGVRLELQLAHTLFSSAGVDPGSALLLRHLQAHLQALPPSQARRALDLGCGHGTLGIVLQALDTGREVTYVDRDALALDYTVRNLAANRLLAADERPAVRGSLGYDDLAPDVPFDLVVSNLPGKAGAPVIAELVHGAAGMARPGAIVGFVAVKPLAGQVARLLADPRFEPIERRANNSYEVFIARITESPAPPAEPGFDRGVYDRHAATFQAGRLAWTARTVHGLGEFDTLSHSTRMLGTALGGLGAGTAVVVDPGQGHRAVIAARSGWRPSVLVGRDLLALRASARCLAGNGLPVPDLVHAATVDPSLYGRSSMLLFDAADRVHLPWLAAEVERYLAHRPGTGPGGQRHLVLTGRSGPLGRLEADVLRRHKGRVAFRRSEKGFRVLHWVAR